MGEHHQPECQTKNEPGPALVGLKERLHCEPPLHAKTAIGQPLHKNEALSRATTVQSIIVLVSTMSSGKFLAERRGGGFSLKVWWLECMRKRRLARIIHDGSSRNRAVALRDRHAE